MSSRTFSWLTMQAGVKVISKLSTIDKEDGAFILQLDLVDSSEVPYRPQHSYVPLRSLGTFLNRLFDCTLEPAAGAQPVNLPTSTDYSCDDFFCIFHPTTYARPPKAKRDSTSDRQQGSFRRARDAATAGALAADQTAEGASSGVKDVPETAATQPAGCASPVSVPGAPSEPSTVRGPSGRVAALGGVPSGDSRPDPGASASASTAQTSKRRCRISVMPDGDSVPRKKAKVKGGAGDAGKSMKSKAGKATLDSSAQVMPRDDKSIGSLTASERATLGLPPLLIKHPNTSMGQHIRFDECELLFCPVVRGSMTFS